jgi:hypothetical protein
MGRSALLPLFGMLVFEFLERRTELGGIDTGRTLRYRRMRT